MFDVEARVEVSLEHAGAEFLELEAAGATLREQRDHPVVVKVGLLGVEKCLADAHNICSDHHLVSHLRVLTGAWDTHVRDLLRVDVEERLDTLKSCISTTYHSD